MAGSATRERKASSKLDMAMRITDRIIERFNPKKSEAGVVVMWTEHMNEFNAANWTNHPVWRRDDRLSHEHWKTYRHLVKRRLEGHYKLTVIPVNRRIRTYLNHGSFPDRSKDWGTDVWYHSCLPNAGPKNETRGFVLFPPKVQEDHPLILEWDKRRLSHTTSAQNNSVGAVRKQKDRQNLSEGAYREMLQATVKKVQKTFRDAAEDFYPLFPKEMGELS